MFGPLLDPFAIAELQQQSGDNLMHRCQVQTTENGRDWDDVWNATEEPCRLSRPTPKEVRAQGDTAFAAASTWVLAARPGWPHAGARLRYIVTGEDGGRPFSRTVFSIGSLTPLPQVAESRVLCTEDPLAVAGS